MKIQLSEHFGYRKLLRYTLPSILMMILPLFTVWWTAFSSPILWEKHPLPLLISSCRF